MEGPVGGRIVAEVLIGLLRADEASYLSLEPDWKPNTKATALRVIRRACGPDRADSLADRLPGRIDLADAAHTRLLSELGLTPDGLFNELGAEL